MNTFKRKENTLRKSDNKAFSDAISKLKGQLTKLTNKITYKELSEPAATDDVNYVSPRAMIASSGSITSTVKIRFLPARCLFS